MLEKNVFLDIISGAIAADILHQDDRCLAFRDISPQAPTHFLVIPKKVIRTHADLVPEDGPLVGHLHLVAAKVAADEGLTSYRLILNCNEQAGQTVPHLHLHVLGGRSLAWPPG